MNGQSSVSTLGLPVSDSPARLDGGVVEDILESEQERRGEHRLGHLGCNA